MFYQLSSAVNLSRAPLLATTSRVSSFSTMVSGGGLKDWPASFPLRITEKTITSAVLVRLRSRIDFPCIQGCSLTGISRSSISSLPSALVMNDLISG